MLDKTEIGDIENMDTYRVQVDDVSTMNGKYFDSRNACRPASALRHSEDCYTAES